MREFRFQSITTEEFVEFLRMHHPSIIDVIDLSDWIYGVNLPKDSPQADSKRILELVAIANQFIQTDEISEEEVQTWSPQEWQIFLSQLSSGANIEICSSLDQQFQLSKTNNLEIRVAFLILAINKGYEPAFEITTQLLSSLGRMKYLRPLYSALSKHSEKTLQLAIETFEKAKASYHPVALSLVQSIIAQENNE